MSELLTAERRALVVQLAEGLSEAEVLAYMGMDETDLNEEDLRQFKIEYLKGRAQFKYFAVCKLKESMTGRNGMQASLAALTRFAEEWPASESNDHNGVQRNFRIILDGENN